MNILILYPFYNQRELMHNFAARLAEGGVIVDSICINNYQYEKNTTLKWSKFLMLCIAIIRNNKNRYVARCARYVTKRWLLPNLFSQYDLIDFHAYYPSYNPLMRACVESGLKFDITLWGSDLMRADDERKEILRYGFDHCHRIKMTQNLYDAMVEYYGDIYKDKYSEVYFGSSEVDQIDKVCYNEAIEIKNKLYGYTDNKIIVVCGYNGTNSQNHNKMIAALCCLSDKEKNSIHLVLPMTYGATPDYVSKIRKEMEKSDISFTLLDHFLDAKYVAVIRKTADIVVNVQNTDALSDSLKGHLYCGNVCIFGEWLNYSPYTNNGIYYIKSSKEELTEHLKDVLSNFEDYHQRCIGNHDKIKSLFSWDATIKKQIAVYGE